MLQVHRHRVSASCGMPAFDGTYLPTSEWWHAELSLVIWCGYVWCKSAALWLQDQHSYHYRTDILLIVTFDIMYWTLISWTDWAGYCPGLCQLSTALFLFCYCYSVCSYILFVMILIYAGVSIVIPAGALPESVQQEIYFKVCQDNSIMPPLDKDKGKVLLTRQCLRMSDCDISCVNYIILQIARIVSN